MKKVIKGVPAKSQTIGADAILRVWVAEFFKFFGHDYLPTPEDYRYAEIAAAWVKDVKVLTGQVAWFLKAYPHTPIGRLNMSKFGLHAPTFVDFVKSVKDIGVTQAGCYPTGYRCGDED